MNKITQSRARRFGRNKATALKMYCFANKLLFDRLSSAARPLNTCAVNDSNCNTFLHCASHTAHALCPHPHTSAPIHQHYGAASHTLPQPRLLACPFLERESEPPVQNRTEEKHLHGKIALLR